MNALDHGADDTLMAEALERWANITNSYAGSIDSDLWYEDRQIVSKAVRMFPALLETARIAGNYLAAVDALEFAMAPYTYDVEVDSDTARTDEWHTITRGSLVLALAKLTPKETT